jgi:hypothetical protein
MVAGSLVVTTAPAQAQTTCPGFQSLSAFLALANGCQDGDKVYVGNSGLTSSGSFLDGVIFIDNMQNPSGDVHRISYSRSGLSAMPAGSPYNLAYKVSIVPGSGATFSAISLGADVAGQQPGISITKAIYTGDWSGVGSQLLTTLTSTDGSTGGPYSVPTGITELFILDTVTYGNSEAQFNSFTNTFTQTPQQQPSVPEPSALLGLGLLGLGGLISKTRRRG